jgi:hypothetical protein
LSKSLEQLLHNRGADFVSRTSERWNIERDEDWRDWVNHVPKIRFDPEWEVQVIPPFSGALVRFRVHLKGKWASVYLDPHNLLGYYEGEPYWEVYPYLDDVGRCDMDDIETLLEMIRTSLND